MTSLKLLFILSFALTSSCKKKADYSKPENFPYDLNAPTQRFDLPAELKEISGLSYFSEGKLACIQDEDGTVFIYDILKKEIDKIKFAGAGDYEGVEIVEDTIYVIKSDGEILYFPKNSPNDIQRVRTSLNETNDVEGLGFDENSRALLIACKKKGETLGKKMKGKAFYLFPLNRKEMVNEPFLILDKSNFKDPDFKIKPSAIALHPITNNLYILSASPQSLTIVEKNEVKEVILLDPEIYEKPEGICFDPAGELFISSEGKTGSGYILNFKANQNN